MKQTIFEASKCPKCGKALIADVLASTKPVRYCWGCNLFYSNEELFMEASQ